MVRFQSILEFVLVAACVQQSSVLAFSAQAPPNAVPTGTESTNLFAQLEVSPLVRASDGQSIALSSLWRSGTPFGIADEVSVCAFLRHFG